MSQFTLRRTSQPIQWAALLAASVACVAAFELMRLPAALMLGAIGAAICLCWFEAGAVMRRSIAELCLADHKNDPVILARWLGNKTVENFVAWIKQADNSLMVAVEDGKILAVGSVTDSGSIGLNYVWPDARFRGVSRALLRALEARAFARKTRKNCQCTLTSTETARQFYLSNGYLESGAAVGAYGTASGYPMSKPLAAPLQTS